MRYIKASYEKPIIYDEQLRAINPRRLKQACAKKIIIGGMTLELECAYDAGECLAGKSTTIILDDGRFDLEYALGILNSDLITFWYRTNFKALTLAGGYLRINSNEVGSIPIPEASTPDRAAISALVQKCLDADGQGSGVSDWEAEINERVARLYGLTPEEIKIVEEASK